MKRFMALLACLFAFSFGAQPAKAQLCNSPSGFLQSIGPFQIGHVSILGPDCNHLQDGGAPAGVVFPCTLAQGCLGGSQAAATANQIPVYPGAGGAAVPTSAPSWFDSAYCNTIGYLIVRMSGSWTCNNSIPANVDWFANVHGDGATDDTAGINAVLAAVNGIVNFSSKVYCIKTAAGLTTTKANQILQGTGGTLLSACGTDSNIMTANADSVQIRNLSILGAPINSSNTHHDIVLGTACTRCRLDHNVLAGGYYNLLINAAYTFVYDLRTGNAHGTAAIKTLASAGSTPGLYLDSSQIDQNWPVSNPSGLASISAWQATTGYTTGNIVSNNGYYIQEITATCTSGGSAPTNQDYGTSFSDGTCNWKLAAPTTFDGLSIDTGSINVIAIRDDFTGAYTNGIHLQNSGAGAVPIEVMLGIGNTFGNNIVASINAEAGSVLTISEQQIQSGSFSNTIGVWLKSTFTGNYQIDKSIIQNLGNSSDGILDQAGSGNGGSISNNLIYTGGGTAISIGANTNNRAIIGNHGGSSNLGSNASCIFVASGTGDYLNIVGNDCDGATSQLTFSGVTGIHNTVLHNGVVGSLNAPSNGFIQSPVVTVNFNVAGDTAIPIPLPPGFTATITTQIVIGNCSGNITTATFGVNTATGGGGTAVVPAGTAPTVTATTSNTANNIEVNNATNPNNQSYTPVGGNFQFRVGTTVNQTCSVYAKYSAAPL